MQSQKKKTLTGQDLEALLNDTKEISEHAIICPNCKGVHKGEGQSIIKKYISQEDKDKQKICKTCFFCQYYI